MPIIVESLLPTAETFASAIGRETEIVPSLETLKQRLSSDESEYAIVLGPGVNLEAAAALAQTLRVTRPSISVILIRRRVDTQVLAEALRSGMREVVEERDLTGVGEAVQRAADIYQAINGAATNGDGRTGGTLVTVFSPKGGVGKTTLAVNLALALVGREKHTVCLVDLDLAFGDVAITLQLFPARTIADAISMESGMDADLLETLLTPHGSGLSILAAPVQPDAKDSLTPALIGKVLRLLRTRFDYVVIDTAPSLDEHILASIDETDVLLLITTLDVPTLKNVKIAVETLDLLNFPKAQRRLVLNRCDEHVGLSTAKVESTLGMTITALIPSSSQVPSSTNAGEPIAASLPRHAVSKAIAGLAATLEPAPVGADPTASAQHAPHKRSLLRRNGR